MKIWLNNKKVKEYKYYIPCYSCVFNRNIPPGQWSYRCLLQIVNLRNDHDWCFRGYGYEDMA